MEGINQLELVLEVLGGAGERLRVLLRAVQYLTLIRARLGFRVVL